MCSDVLFFFVFEVVYVVGVEIFVGEELVVGEVLEDDIDVLL